MYLLNLQLFQFLCSFGVIKAANLHVNSHFPAGRDKQKGIQGAALNCRQTK
jgi:hypothetical protein